MESPHHNEEERDESFKRPGSIPFKWEIQPGIPKPNQKTTAAAVTTPESPKLRLPPSQTPLEASNSPRCVSLNPNQTRVLVRYTGTTTKLYSSPKKRDGDRAQGCIPIPSFRRKDEKGVRGVVPANSALEMEVAAGGMF